MAVQQLTGEPKDEPDAYLYFAWCKVHQRALVLGQMPELIGKGSQPGPHEEALMMAVRTLGICKILDNISKLCSVT